MAFLVTVLSAFDLRDARMFGNVQPYAEVEVNGRKQRSKTDRQRGATPDWRHGFRFTAGPDDVLTLVVYDDQLTKCVELGRASLRLGDVSGKGEFQLRLSHKGLPAGTVVLQAAPCLGSALSELNGPGLATAQAPLSVPPPGLAQSQTLASASFALAPPALATPPQPLATPAPYVDRALPPTFAPHHAASLPPHLAAVAAAPAAAPWPAPLAGAAPPWPPPAPPRPAVVPSCPPAPAPSSAAAPRPQQPALGPQRALAQPSSLPHHSTLPAGALGLRAASPRVLMLLVDGSASMLRPCGWDEALLRAEFAFAVLRHVVAALARCTGSRTGLRTVAVAAQGSEADMGYMTVEGAEGAWEEGGGEGTKGMSSACAPPPLSFSPLARCSLLPPPSPPPPPPPQPCGSACCGRVSTR